MRHPLGIVALVSVAGLTYATPTGLGSDTPTKILEARSFLPAWLAPPFGRPRTIEPRTPDTQSMHTDDGGNADGDEINANYFQVPNTKTTMNVYLGTIGLAPAQLEILNATASFVDAQLTASGDGQLPQAVDPLYYDLRSGCWVKISSMPGQHLTWGILGAATKWIFKHLGEASQYRHGASINIHDSDWGIVGTFIVGWGYTGTTPPQVVQGPAGVTNYGRSG